MDDVEPERQLAELYGGGVEVDAIDVVRGDIGFHLLNLVAALGRRDVLTEFLLPVGDIEFGKLVDDLILKCRGAHGGLQYLEFQQVLCAERILGVVQSVYKALQGVFHRALGQHLWGIVACALLAVAAVEPVDEGALGNGEQLSIRAELDLVLMEVVQSAGGNKVGTVLLSPRLEHLGIVLLGIEATVGQQRLID